MPADSGAPPAVYLHIGAPKSGTTFLQGLLWSNAAALSEAGVLLPGGSFDAHVRATRDLRGLKPEPGEPGADWDGAWDRLADRIKASTHRVAVVSHEVMCAVDAEGAERAVRSLAPCEVHIVYSARDLAGLLPSEWQEYVKHRFHYGFEHWLREVVDGPRDAGAAEWFWRVHDIPDVLGRWAPHVPPERVHVLTMPGPDAPRERLWERFAGLLGVDPAVADLTAARANASLSWTETELLRRVNCAVDEDVPMWLYHRLVTDVLALKVLPGRGEPGRVPLPADRRAWAEEKAGELVGAVRAAGYDVVGDLSELLPGDPPQEERPAAPGDAELLEAAAHTILGLLERISMLRREIGGLQRERQEQRRTALPKLMARHLSERNQAVWKMRVGYWHLVERLKGIEPVPPGPAVAPADSAGNGGDDAAGKGAGIAPGKAANRSGANGNGVVLSSRRPRR
ncbi:hypothetical protein FHX41_0829 [Actinomadura hallensis]|uniref:Sulfotransferase family protein n=1 Tax=Actinomadura hallensis TaxID=337895 RepID=A0A543I9F5_9ACTN|nr:hypothetical protein [Actinomadura hallensis]TQM67224.1 hypothetical protein FHX41_0829 [Actinomadura hallensis]